MENDQQLSNEISAPYEVPQYPIEQIETKLIRWVFIFRIVFLRIIGIFKL